MGEEALWYCTCCTNSRSRFGKIGIGAHWDTLGRLQERGNGEEAATVLTVFLREMRQKSEELMQQSEMAGAASVLAGLSAQASGVVGEWGADEIDVDLEEEEQEGVGDNTFDLASSVLEELGEGGNGDSEDE